MRLRSALFVPCVNPRALEKSIALKADALIFDLEDSVGPEEKTRAISQLKTLLAKAPFAAPYLMVRLNGPDEAQDLGDSLTKINALVLPKVEELSGLQHVSKAYPELDLWAMIETPKSVLNLGVICQCATLKGLILGPNDLRFHLNSKAMDHRRDDLAYAMGALILHARAHGLIALDGVYNDYKDIDGFSREARFGRDMGFEGKTLIHPDQIEPAHEAFSPTKAEFDWARAVISGFDAAPQAGVLSIKGQMVERLHLERAKAIIALV